MKSYTVLLVQQSRTFAATVQSFLEKETIKLIHLDTVTAALKYLDKSVPDVILLDLEMDGMKILNSVQFQQVDCNVIVIAGSNSADLVAEAMHHGAVDKIEKPLNKTQFLKTLRKILNAKTCNTLILLKFLPPPTPQKFNNFIALLEIQKPCWLFTTKLKKSLIARLQCSLPGKQEQAKNSARRLFIRQVNARINRFSHSIVQPSLQA